VHKIRHPIVEDAGPHLQPEEICIMRKKRRIQIGFDRGEINAVVFCAWVITHNYKAEHRKTQNGQAYPSQTAMLQTQNFYSLSRNTFRADRSLDGKWFGVEGKIYFGESQS
jgi:hypothetical protein